ncbi:uncharacterized protein K02A2.6-like [Galendromus occidentalis]|uniref:RNA-directed DNA polymerase n=1 Tax=Galendromus occidentalis TaxID=34638 RepID=A0AAJ7L4J5_9ACAR|nr:uncharacterized protein K02A2.6-like [Galendromus occidentalis]
MRSLNIKRDGRNLKELTSAINEAAEEAEWGDITLDEMKQYILMLSLQSHDDSDTRTRAARLLEQDRNLSFSQIMDDLDHFESIKRDLCASNRRNINGVEGRTSKTTGRPQQRTSTSKIIIGPSYICYRCNKPNHHSNDCKYKTYECEKCFKIGHLGNACKSRTNNQQPSLLGATARRLETRAKITIKASCLTNISSVITLHGAVAISNQIVLKLREIIRKKGEDNTDRWKAFQGAFLDYAIVDKLFEERPFIQMAKFRAVLGEDNRQLVENLDIGPIADFLQRLNRQLKKCEFGPEAKTILRDLFVLGSRHTKAQEACFREEYTKLDVQRASQIIEMYEDNEKSVKHIAQQRSETEETANVVRNRVRSNVRNVTNCTYCGSSHPSGKCPAYGKICKTCQKRGHFTKVCRSDRNRQNHRAKINMIKDDESDGEETRNEYNSGSEEDIYATRSNQRARKMYITLAVPSRKTRGSFKLKALLDTGATVNVVGMQTLEKLRAWNAKVSELDPTKRTTLNMYDNSSTRTAGTVDINIRQHNGSQELRFQVIPDNADTLISAQTCLDLELIQLSPAVECVNQITENYQEKLLKLKEQHEKIFVGLGRLPNKVKIQVKPGATPVQQPPRRTPVALIEPLIKRIKEMELAGIIERVEHPTKWVNNIVPVHRDGKKLRICLDPHYLNKAIERPRYPMPTLQDALHRLRNAKIFTVIDASDGFYQMELDEESADLTTFWSPLGRYRYRRVPQGIASAPEEYQMRQIQAYDGLKGVIVVADDTLVFGTGDDVEEARKDHYENLKALFERAEEIGLKFNREKLKLGQIEVRFLGHIISREGLKVDPEKTNAIIKMKPPTNVKETQTFLGCVNYLMQFIPNLSKTTEPLRRLTQTDKYDFAWQSEQQEAFEKIKKQLTETPTLAYYDPERPIVIQTDACEHGTGGVMLQEGRPIAYTSRTLSKTEQSYATIEKECLAILLACQKFDQYIYGVSEVVVQTDHKPLETIFQKPLDTCPKRLQRMRLALQRYALKVEYIKGTNNPIADLLSRKPTASELAEESILRLQLQKIDHRDSGRISDILHERLQTATRNDETSEKLKEAIRNGWKVRSPQLQRYWTIRDELIEDDGIIYKGSAVIVPKALRAELAKRTHKSHLGYDAMCRRASGTIYWPGIRNDLKNIVESCESCQIYRPKQRREPLRNKPIPQHPWQTIHQDLFVWEGRHYLVTIDGFSDFFELDCLGRETTTSNIIRKTENLLARYGRPSELHTDSDPRYLSSEFQQFLESWHIKHIRSSPHNHQSNGKSESAVKVAKRIVKKTTHLGENLQQALLEWRATPQKDGTSPYQKLFNREMGTLTPAGREQQKPTSREATQNQIAERRAKQKKYYDRGTRALSQLAPGQKVRVQPSDYSHEWELATCISQLNPRTYIIETPDGANTGNGGAGKNPRDETSGVDTDSEQQNTPIPKNRTDNGNAGKTPREETSGVDTDSEQQNTPSPKK